MTLLACGSLCFLEGRVWHPLPLQLTSPFAPFSSHSFFGSLVLLSVVSLCLFWLVFFKYWLLLWVWVNTVFFSVIKAYLWLVFSLVFYFAFVLSPALTFFHSSFVVFFVLLRPLPTHPTGSITYTLPLSPSRICLPNLILNIRSLPRAYLSGYSEYRAVEPCDHFHLYM